MKASAVFALLAQAQFREFTQSDWDCYAGCESAWPKIADIHEFTLIIDGDVLQVLNVEKGEYWQVSLSIEEI